LGVALSSRHFDREPQDCTGLPHRRVWEWREDDAEPYWVVRLAEIPEVVGDGGTCSEAEAALRQCLADYVRYREAEGLTIPEPEARAAAG
jgi:predicted RNase H-like HicB family nuclease